MKVLVACEFSGRVRDAFIAAGHDAVSIDFKQSEQAGPHIVGDVRDYLADGWDLMIAHPPCRYLAVSGARWFAERRTRQRMSLRFVRQLLSAPIPRIAVENPKSVISTAVRKPDQIIHPWQFGHGERKETCLWLKNLPPLRPTRLVNGRVQRTLWESPSSRRWRERTRTLPGIARAMAEQWGAVTSDVYLIIKRR